MTAEAPKIVLADDEDTFRRATAALLEQEGYRCDCAHDSESAGRLVTDRHDTLISDIRMPGNMQFEFLREIRRRFPLLPIVLVTGYPSVQTAVESIRLSFTDYLLKPVDWPDLLRAVRRAVRKARLVRMTAAAREEAGRVTASLERVQEVVAHSQSQEGSHTLAWPLEQVLTHGFAQMAVLSTHMQSVIQDQLHSVGEAPTDVCRTMKCPRRSAYQEALTDAIEVVERTKSAFRSKDLGALRSKLERLLEADRTGAVRPPLREGAASGPDPVESE